MQWARVVQGYSIHCPFYTVSYYDEYLQWSLKRSTGTGYRSLRYMTETAWAALRKIRGPRRLRGCHVYCIRAKIGKEDLTHTGPKSKQN